MSKEYNSTQHRSGWRRRGRRNRGAKAVMPAAVALILAAAVLFAGCGRKQAEQATSVSGGSEQQSQSQSAAGEQSGPNSAREVVTINGIPCYERGNIRAFLFLGIDDGEAHTETYDIGGMCDVLRLLVIDNTNKTYVQIPINRNTIATVRSYDEEGEFLGTTEAQIAYAHMEGGGGTASAENTVTAVSDYLYGIPIDGYVSMEMDGIAVLNRLAGGVTVTIDEDLTEADPAFTEGSEIRLTDEQAVAFVRARMAVSDGTNESRMRRQNQFIDGFRQNMMERLSADKTYIEDVYREMSAIMDTDLTEKDFSRIANALLECESLGVAEIPGEIGEDQFGYATFTANPDALADLVIDTFYTRAEE